MRSPYTALDARAFWRTGVAQTNPQTINDLYRPKFAFGPQDTVATAGSCFAQHISKRLRQAGVRVLDAEPAPRGLSDDDSKRFGYGLFSARFGNIYVCRQLLQLAQEACGEWRPSEAIWQRDGLYFDAMRPGVEPLGLSSPEEVQALRQQHLKAVRTMLETASVFIFTLGLTESWMHRESGTVYPTAPGTIAGDYAPETFVFKNFGVQEVVDDFSAFRRLAHRHNPAMKFLLTVSPVPLTATASAEHVLVATTESKAVLRAAAGQLARQFDDVDYFPSFEMIATPFSRGRFFEDNLRSVTPDGVEAVMRVFAQAHLAHTVAMADTAAPLAAAPMPADDRATGSSADHEVVCEEALLEAFAS